MAKNTTKTTAKTRHPLAQAPLNELAAELARRKAGLPKLLQRRDRLRAELEQLDAQIAMLEGLDGSTGRTAPGGGAKKTRKASGSTGRSTGARRSPGGGSTLREKIGEVLGSDPMRPVEIARTLVERGLHEGGKSLHVQVSTTLAKFDDFAKVARGQWIRSDGQK
ncbi:MAG: hypothetical protein VX672_00555 [Planctomycetota bacterium]|nr:hypothetical protein [Planctomycetota bacterium]